MVGYSLPCWIEIMEVTSPGLTNHGELFIRLITIPHGNLLTDSEKRAELETTNCRLQLLDLKEGPC